MSYTFAVGDIHGCLAPLERLLGRIEAYANQGRVVFLGDYIDRGPDSRGVIDLLMRGPTAGWEWICLKGNHEAMMVAMLRKRSVSSHWIENGGAETLVSFGGEIPADVISWCDDLPLYSKDSHRFFVHAGVEPRRPTAAQIEQVLLWHRFPPEYPGGYQGLHLVHGHTPSEANPRTVGNRTNVDSACVFGGALSCAVFDNNVAGGPVDFLIEGSDR